MKPKAKVGKSEGKHDALDPIDVISFQARDRYNSTVSASAGAPLRILG
jgi:hypothetical protein